MLEDSCQLIILSSRCLISTFFCWKHFGAAFHPFCLANFYMDFLAATLLRVIAAYQTRKIIELWCQSDGRGIRIREVGQWIAPVVILFPSPDWRESTQQQKKRPRRWRQRRWRRCEELRVHPKLECQVVLSPCRRVRVDTVSLSSLGQFIWNQQFGALCVLIFFVFVAESQRLWAARGARTSRRPCTIAYHSIN